MESILERSNMIRAIKRVIKNKGAPGVDGMTVHQVERYFRRHRRKIEQALLNGTYMPMPVRRKEIPKPGGVRLLGIPTALDRVIQPRSKSGIFDRPRLKSWRRSGIIRSQIIALDSDRNAPNTTLFVSTGSMCEPG